MKSKQILNLLKIVSWAIFIGLCIQTGAILLSFIISLFINPKAAEDLYMFMNFSQLYDYSLVHYIVVVSFTILILIFKVYMFFLVLKTFKTVNIDNPFSVKVAKIISKISVYAVYLSIVAIIAQAYTLWLVNQMVFIPYNWGTTEIVFMTGVIYIISYLFKRAAALQSENELTI